MTQMLDDKSSSAPFSPGQLAAEIRKSALRRLFKSPVFNRRDGLDDYDADFRSYGPIGDMVTADMRHRMEQAVRDRKRKEPDHSPGTAEDHPVQSPAPHPAPEAVPPEKASAEIPEPLKLMSEGKIVIVGDAAAAAACARRLKNRMACALVITGPAGASDVYGSAVPSVHAPLCRISGGFTRFGVYVGGTGGEKSLETALGPEWKTVDLVLDLQSPPAMAGGVHPPGYYAPDGDEKLRSRMLDELPRMKGFFEKDPFVLLDPHQCGHRRRGIDGCRTCADRCPSRAIETTKDGVRIDHLICTGCGICSLSCPGGAVSFINPDLRQSLEQIRPNLSERFRPALVFFEFVKDEENGGDFPTKTDASQSTFVAVGVPAIAAVGMDIWFAALACGAGEIILCPSAQTPAAATAELADQVRTAGELLAGVGLSPNRVRMVPPGLSQESVLFDRGVHDDGWDENAAAPATFGLLQSKRQLILASLKFLHERAGGLPGVVQLPEGAAFGDVRISKEDCTLCMACVAVCPVSALSAGADHPCLGFYESACIQCGLCAAACPERAISLHPRMVMPPVAPHACRVLHEDAPFCCIRCGRPFAARATLDRIAEKLQGHWMFQKSNELKRLQMCRDCRVADLFREERPAAGEMENQGKE